MTHTPITRRSQPGKAVGTAVPAVGCGAGEFGEQLVALFRRAGAPSLRAAATAVSRGEPTVSPQRISDWRNGRHIPHEFGVVEPLLVWLTARAVSRESDGTASTTAPLLSIPAWRTLWTTEVGQVPGPDTSSPITPFRGLAPFDPSDSQMYFGREELVAELALVVAEARNGSGPAIVVVAGASGAGKSSLLGAGIASAPDLSCAHRCSVTAHGFVPDPFTAEPDLVVIDQFESVFSHPPETVDRALADLERLSTGDTVVIIGVRSDFFDRCVRSALLAQAWGRNCVIVGPMNDDQLREIILGPVRAARGRVENGLADVMIADVHNASDEDAAGRLPLLAHVLASTWERRTGNRMTIAGYRETGGVASALAATAESAWDEIGAGGHQDLARSLLVALTVLGPRGIPLRAPLTREDVDNRFPTEVGAVIEILASARLLTVSANGVTLVHDVVLHAWPRLAGWIDQDRAAHMSRQQLDDDAHTWIDSRRDRSFLYRGARLEEALRHRESYSDRYHHLLSVEQELFLDAAVGSERRKRVVTVSAIIVVVILAIVSTTAAAISLRQSSDLREQRNTAQRSALLSEISNLRTTDPSLAARLSVIAHLRSPDDDGLQGSLMTAANAPLSRLLTGHTGPVYNVSYSADGRLMASASGDRTVRLWTTRADGDYAPASVLTGFGDYVTSVAFHPTKPVLAAASGDGTVRVWDISRREAPRLSATLRPGRGTTYVIAFSDDGTQLIAPSDDKSISVYSTAVDPSVPQPVSVIRGHNGPVRFVAFKPGTHLLASGGDDATVRFWDTSDPRAPRPVGAPVGGFASITHSLAFSPDGTHLAVTGDSPDATILDVSDPARPVRAATALPGTTAGSWSAQYSATRPLLAAASEDGIVKVWNVSDPASPRLLWALQHAPAAGALTSSSVAISPDGGVLSAGQSDGSIAVWRLPSNVIPTPSAAITGIATSADQSVVATVGTDTTLAVASGSPLQIRSATAIERMINDHPVVAMSSDGTQVATANNNGRHIQLFDITDPAAPILASTLNVGTRFTYHVSFVPGRHLLATGETDRSVRLWDTTDLRSPRPIGQPITGPADLVRGIAFDDRAALMAVASDDKRTYVYDVRDPARPTLAATLADRFPVQAVTFAPDGRSLYTAGADVSAWDIGDLNRPTLAATSRELFAESLSANASGVVVGTAARQVLTFSRTDEGLLQPGPPLTGLESTDTTWLLPARTPPGAPVLIGGDRTGSLYARDADIAAGRQWICSATSALTEQQRAQYLPGTGRTDECAG